MILGTKDFQGTFHFNIQVVCEIDEQKLQMFVFSRGQSFLNNLISYNLLIFKIKESETLNKNPIEIKRLRRKKKSY